MGNSFWELPLASLRHAGAWASSAAQPCSPSAICGVLWSPRSGGRWWAGGTSVSPSQLHASKGLIRDNLSEDALPGDLFS